jgi:hypothetical protein
LGDDAEIRCRWHTGIGVVGDLRMLIPEFPKVFVRIKFGHTGHVADLNLLQQLVAADVDDADPVRAVVADVGLEPSGQEDGVEGSTSRGMVLIFVSESISMTEIESPSGLPW